MRQWLSFCSVAMMIVVLCTACGGKADYDIQGTWDYTMVLEDGNTYDQGTITFTGETTTGTYLQVNIYTVEYAGEYTVKGTVLKLTGDEVWQGTLTSAVEMAGTWVHEGEARGTWTAVKETD
jgi:hypothetical protein